MHETVSLSDFNLTYIHLLSQGDVWARPASSHQWCLDRLHEVLPHLPPLDRDVLHLLLVEGLTQRQIGPIIGMTQQGVCRRLESATRRLAFLVGHPRIEDELPGLLAPLLDDAQEIDVLCRYGRCAHQSQVALDSGISQQWTHTLYQRGLLKLLAHPSLTAQFLAAWFISLAAQRYLYALPRRTEGSRRPAARRARGAHRARGTHRARAQGRVARGRGQAPRREAE